MSAVTTNLGFSLKFKDYFLVRREMMIAVATNIL